MLDRRTFSVAGAALAALALVWAQPLPCAEVEDAVHPEISALWVEPTDLESRDLFHGPGGGAKVPPTDVVYRFKKKDATGHSRGYTVVDPEGRKWKVKVGDEASAEVAVSRILWAIGYHQPALYYVPEWKMSGGPKGKRPEPGRFRLESDHKIVGRWAWAKENPFAGTRPYRGLLVVNLLLNNWDLDTSQNRVYQMKGRIEGPKLRYVVQDVGGSLGRTHLPVGSRNDVVGFESQNLLDRVEDGRVRFDYHARHRALFRQLTPEDVIWACKLLARLSEAQLGDAFRAAGYSNEIGERFVRKIERKIQEGLALDRRDGGER